MKAAFSAWESRIAPVFDASNQIRIVEVESGKIVRNELETLPADLAVQKALRLAEIKIEILVCGAISRTMHDLIMSYGIRVIPFVSGRIEEIIQAWMSGRTDWARFAMPGCMGGGRRRGRGGDGDGWMGQGGNARGFRSGRYQIRKRRPRSFENKL